MNDLIDRQAAIEALKDEWAGVPVYYLCGEDIFEYSKFRIESLPSAEPEIIRCKDCKYADEYYHCEYMTTWNIGDSYCYLAKRKGE